MLPAFLLGGVAPLIREDLPAFEEQELGIAVSLFFLTSGCASVLGGRLSESRGPRLGMTVAAGISAAATLGVATSGHLVVLLAAASFAGFANGVAQPASNLTLAWGVPLRRQGLAFGIKQAAVPAGSLVAGLSLPLLGLHLGWRATFALASPFALVVIALVPKRVRRHSMAAARSRPRARMSLQLAFLAAASGCGAAAANSLSSFLVLASVAAGLDVGAAGSLLAFGSVTSIFTRLAVGRLADRRDGEHLRTVATMLALGGCGYVLVALGDQHVAFLLLGVTLAFSAGWGWPGLLLFAVVRLNPSAPGSSTGITSAGAASGGVIGPLVFGLVAEHASYVVAWLCASSFAAIGVGCILAARALGRGRAGCSRSPLVPHGIPVSDETPTQHTSPDSEAR